MHKRAFVLSGGGARGDFQLGALRFLYDNGIKPERGELIVSCSIGSIHAVKLAEGTDRGSDPLAELEAIWLGLRNNADMYIERPWLTRVKDLIADAGGGLVTVLESTSGIVAAAINPLGWIPLIISAFETLDNVADLKRTLEEGLRETSINEMSPSLLTRIRTLVHPLSVAFSGIQLRMAVVELESGRLRYMTERGEFDDDPSGGVVGDLWQGAVASAAIPVFFPAVALNGSSYVDGGVRDVVPIKRAVEMGADEIWAISCSPRTPAPLDRPEGGFGLQAVLERATGLQDTEIQASAEDPFNGWPTDVKLIAPTIAVHTSREIVPTLIRISREYGWMRAEDLLCTLYPPPSSPLPVTPAETDDSWRARSGGDPSRRTGPEPSPRRELHVPPSFVGSPIIHPPFGPRIAPGALPASDPNRRHPVLPRSDYAETSDEIAQNRAGLFDLDGRVNSARSALRTARRSIIPYDREFPEPSLREALASQRTAIRRLQHAIASSLRDADIARQRLRDAIQRRLDLHLHLPGWIRREDIDSWFVSPRGVASDSDSTTWDPRPPRREHDSS